MNFQDKCGEITDKYIEFEVIIILIDLILLSRPVYRHILYNTNFKNHWKISVVLMLLEAYYIWSEKNYNSSENANDYNRDPFIAEKGFYFCCIEILFGNFVLFLFIRILTLTSNPLMDAVSKRNLSLDLWKGITLANGAKFFLLPIIIWKENSSETSVGIHLELVKGYFLLSLIHVYSVITTCSNYKAAFIVIISFIAKSLIMYLIYDSIGVALGFI